MSFKDDLRNKLGEDMFNDVVDKLGDDFNYDVVPRTRLNEVIKKRNEYQSQLSELTGGTQHQSNGGNSNNGSNGNNQNQQQQNQQSGSNQGKSIEELRAEWETEKNKEVTALRVKYAGLDALRSASAVDAELVYSLLDKDKLSIGEDGKLAGMDDQLTAIKEARPYLFTTSQGGSNRDNTPGGTGKSGGTEKFESVKSKEDFLKLSYEEQRKFKEAHPQVFQKFLNSF